MTVLSEVLTEQMKKEFEQKVSNNEKIYFSDLQKAIPDLKMTVSRNRRIDGRMGCGAGYNVCLQRGNVKYYTKYNTSIMDGERRPNKMDILYCITSDARSYTYTTSFSDFCSEFGYDEYEDRAKAQRVYKFCMTASMKLEQMFNDKEFEILDKVFENY
jgi:nucleoid-associated protein YejK